MTPNPPKLINFNVFFFVCFVVVFLDRQVQLDKAVTSIALRGEGQQFFVGTEAAQIYHYGYDDFKAELISSSHSRAVNDVAMCL